MGKNSNNTPCFHCGDDCGSAPVVFESKSFCCNGCKTVYEIFSENNLTQYYEIQSGAGASPKEVTDKYAFLDNTEIVSKLLEFNEDNTQVVNLYIPHIHCSSCIWVLENLNKLSPHVVSATVDFPKKTVRVVYGSAQFSLKELVLLLARVGYEPYIALDDYDGKRKKIDRSLVYKLGLAGFAFGNVMLLSFPEYFEVNEFWLERYKVLFRWLMFAFSVPVVAYAAQDYFSSAYKGLRSKILNIDVPISLGILALFFRSLLEIVMDWGQGYFDSLTGLVFFLLLGRFFQQKTYSYMSFERDYKSYFPIGVTRIAEDGREETVPVHDIKKGDRLLIRNEELIPVDGILMAGNAHIDYSFVTGESDPVEKVSGDRIFAGGKQLSGAIEIRAVKEMSQSYLTRLWGNQVFQKDKSGSFQGITDRIGKNFTIGVLSIATLATLFWVYFDAGRALEVFTSVLIIACPCAIALAAPFTLGNMLRILGRKQLYLKDTKVLERLAKVDAAVFDKTGTLTTSKKHHIAYEGIQLSAEEETLLRTTLRASSHPLSRALYLMLQDNGIMTLDEYHEHVGQGIEGIFEHNHIKVGSARFVGQQEHVPMAYNTTAVHVSANDAYKGYFVFSNDYREGMGELLAQMGNHLHLSLLSGDNAGEREVVAKLFPQGAPLRFGQKPEDKLHYIKELQDQGRQVLMLGDGLNDAGALAQSDVGIAISENVNVFSPACDAILHASKLPQLARYLWASKRAMAIIKWSFLFSLIYNLIGIAFAVTGHLRPVVAAILMPLSSISIVAFTTVATNLLGRKLE